MKKINRFLSIGLSLLLISGCGSKQEVELQKYSMTATDLGFDTVITFTAYAENEATYKKYEAIVKEQFRHYDQLFDKYDAYKGIPNIKTINEAAGKEAIKVDPAIIELLTLSKSYDSLTNHNFDITMGEVFNVWHEYRETGLIANEKDKKATIPTKKELAKANLSTGWENIEINEKESTVYIKNKDTQLDVGGVAKGFAVEKVAKELEKAGCKKAIVNGGGNVRLLGSKPQNEPWNVGIQIPNLTMMETDSLVTVSIDSSKSIVTSGDYQRFYMYGDQIMHHIIDPSTLYPARHSRSVTVVTDDSGIADILSTTLYTMSHKDGEKLIKELKDKDGIEVGAIWVYDDKQKVEDDSKTISSKGYTIIVSDTLKDMVK